MAHDPGPLNLAKDEGKPSLRAETRPKHQQQCPIQFMLLALNMV